jgi:hypothetical protein
MNLNSYSRQTQRRAELKKFMGADLDDLLEQEAKQSRARVAAQVIHSFVAGERMSAGPLVKESIVPQIHRAIR